MSLVIDCSGLPTGVARVAKTLAASAGAQAVVLAGSRASTDVDAGSDWDLTVYYRGALDLTPLAAFGDVHAPGSWGRLMNGGAWLTVDGLAVDVMLRDLAVVEHWTAEARLGSYELDALLGYLAGLPTYLLMSIGLGRLSVEYTARSPTADRHRSVARGAVSTQPPREAGLTMLAVGERTG